jgi:polysaccharide biosynthesis transport protein
MELIRYAHVLRRWAWMIILCPFVAAVAAAIISFLLPPVYQANVSLLVRPAQPLTVDPGSATLTSDQISRTYAQLMTERPLLEQVNADLDLHTTPENLAKLIKVSPQVNTTIIDVSADNTNPSLARDIANTLVSDFIAQVKSIEQQENTNPTSQTKDNLVVVSPAVTPVKPISPNIPLNTIIALIGGLVVALAIAFLMEYVDQSIKTDEDLTIRVGLIPIAHVPFTQSAKKKRGELVSLQSELPTAEAYRNLRTNILFSGVDRKLTSILVTSAFPGEGKSRTAANLAVVLAEAGHKTLLIDADFRRPSQHRIFGIVSNVGITNLILQDRTEAEAVHAVEGIPNLWVVPSGPRPPNPSEMLGSARMVALLERFAHHFTYVVIDTPPVMAVTDALVVSAKTDATLLVAEQGRTTIPGLKHTREAIERVGGRTIGVVMNKLRAEGSGYYYYYSRSYNYVYGGTPPTRNGRKNGGAKPADELEDARQPQP